MWLILLLLINSLNWSETRGFREVSLAAMAGETKAELEYGIRALSKSALRRSS